jgi:hypothetical protein
MYLEPNLTPRQMRKARREHAGLQATYRKAPWWHLAAGYYTVTCSCGWTDPETIPHYASVEAGPFVTNLSINLAMNRHLEQAYGRRHG